MKRVLFLLCVVLAAESSFAQITVTATDMPVSGDTLRFSVASAVGSTISLGDSGANFVWDYSSLVPVSQNVDTYKTATAVNLLYALTIPSAAYGYKVADSFPGPLPVSIKQLYTFFEKITTPASYAAVAFGASISGIPTPANYTVNDTWYFFPLNYANSDSSNYALNISLATVGALKQSGYRKSRVDGWGTIKTPYYTTPVNCLRIRSEKHEIDSVTFGTTTFGVPQNTVEYKWLANGEHYPALWVTTLLGATGGETITSIRYRDMARYIPPPISGIATPASPVEIKAFPNPAVDGLINLDIPASWQHYHIAVYDRQSRLVLSVDDHNLLDMSGFAAGVYLAQISSGTNMTYVKLVR